jgi:hypothetical protein
VATWLPAYESPAPARVRPVASSRPAETSPLSDMPPDSGPSPTLPTAATPPSSVRPTPPTNWATCTGFGLGGAP